MKTIYVYIYILQTGATGAVEVGDVDDDMIIWFWYDVDDDMIIVGWYDDNQDDDDDKRDNDDIDDDKDNLDDIDDDDDVMMMINVIMMI